MREETKLTKARYALRGHVKCAAVKQDGELITSEEKGIRPMLLWLEDDREILRGASVADRVVGRAAALIMAYAGVKEVFAEVVSRSAISTLEDAEIQYTYVTKCIAVANRRGDGICPMERLTAPITDPAEAYTVLREKVMQDENAPERKS